MKDKWINVFSKSPLPEEHVLISWGGTIYIGHCKITDYNKCEIGFELPELDYLIVNAVWWMPLPHPKKED